MLLSRAYPILQVWQFLDQRTKVSQLGSARRAQTLVASSKYWPEGQAWVQVVEAASVWTHSEGWRTQEPWLRTYRLLQPVQ